MFYLGKDIGFCDLEFGFFALKILIAYILYKHHYVKNINRILELIG